MPSRRTVLQLLSGLLVLGPTLGGTLRTILRASSTDTDTKAKPGKQPAKGVPVMDKSSDKGVRQILKPEEHHWVGDGFYVSTLFSPFQIDPQAISPFLLLDHAAPKHFTPSPTKRGVGEHPHRGFETVTFAYQGEVDHRDSTGGGGRIGPGDVQWMTAGSGVVHEEKHSADFSARGGTFEMVQLWVNLPAKLKMTTPRYQALPAASFPVQQRGAATARVIAGALEGAQGSAETHSPLAVYDLRFDIRGETVLPVAPGWTALALVLEGDITVGTRSGLGARSVVVFDQDQVPELRFSGAEGTRVLVLTGEPLREPVTAHGPFVMNTRAEILQAIEDYNSGAMGHL